MSRVLRNPPADAELIELVNRVLATWKDRLGLHFVGEGTLKNQPRLKIDVWTEATDPTTEIDLVRDDSADVRYLSVMSSNESVRWRMLEQLSRDFDVATLEDLQQDVGRRGDADPTSYLRLALGGGDHFDETSYRLIREGLRSTQPAVRTQAAMAAGLLGWTRLADDAAEALARETDSGIARLLAVAMQIGRAGRL